VRTEPSGQGAMIWSTEGSWTQDNLFLALATGRQEGSITPTSIAPRGPASETPNLATTLNGDTDAGSS
jgi:hypothetical protein